MSTIEVFEPALCCNTGVCGDDVDQALVTFSADMDWAADPLAPDRVGQQQDSDIYLSSEPDEMSMRCHYRAN